MPNDMESLAFNFIVRYSKDETNLLAQLCDKYGTDKGTIAEAGHPYRWRPHTYTDFYARHFDHCREHIGAIFECGLGTTNPRIPSSMGVGGKPGASLRVWRDYFPNARIYGADIDRDILFEEDRISTFYMDQTDRRSIREFWDIVPVDQFDLMIDDGLHTFDAGICLFENSIHKLSTHGIYVIEDVAEAALLQYQRYFENLNYRVDFVSLFRPYCALYDNSLVIIRRR